jgi:hypothetical protein
MSNDDTTIVYGFCLTVGLALAAAMTSATTQSTLMVLTVSSGIALALTALIELSGNRAQRKARDEYVTHTARIPGTGGAEPSATARGNDTLSNVRAL